MSIGVPVYNGEATLRRALDALLAQTFQDFEIIISDNASTDETAKICSEFGQRDSRLHYFRQQKNIGAYANFGAVLEKARGEFFMWAADDDLWSPDYVAKMIANLDGVGTAISDMETIFYTTGKRIAAKMPRLDPGETPYLNAKHFLMNLQPSIIYGVHRTPAIKAAYSAEQMDFLDCLITFRLLTKSGIRTVPGIRYFAGVQTPKYIPKINGGKESRFSYLPVIWKMIGEVRQNNKLNYSEKIRLCLRVLWTFMSVKSHLDETYFGGRGVVLGAIYQLKAIRRKIKFGMLSYFENSWSCVSKKRSYSKHGEDLLIKSALDAIGISKPSYLDIGAYHPFKYSNTYLFYTNGARGICVEPDPSLFQNIERKRPDDLNINCGVADISAGARPFYIMSIPALNTFSEQDAERLERLGQAKMIKKIELPMRGINDLMSSQVTERAPDIVSIDYEGMNLGLVRSIDFQRFRPKALCIETLSYTARGDDIKSDEIKVFLEAQGYMLYADTYINSIFIDAATWRARVK